MYQVRVNESARTEAAQVQGQNTLSRAYAPKVDLQTPAGDHLRYVPGPLARAMVEGGTAEPVAGNGRIRRIRLVTAASTHAAKIGEASPGTIGGVRFVRREHSDDGTVTWWAHHWRATDYGDR